MKRIGSGLVLALAAFVVTAAEVVAGNVKLAPAVAQQAALPPTRVTDQPDALLLALKENDFAALLEAMKNDKDIAQIAKQWDESAAERRAAAAKAEEEKQRCAVSLAARHMASPTPSSARSCPNPAANSAGSQSAISCTKGAAWVATSI